MRKWIAIGCLGLGACMSDAAVASHTGQTLVYFEDPRTGLCFAGKNLSTNNAVMASVACTDAVQRVIAEQQQQLVERDRAATGNGNP